MNDIARKEVNEALLAGQRVLDSLDKASRYLDKARTWGVIDIIGGGFISGLMKHSNLSDAQACLNGVKRDMEDFKRELRDVSMVCDFDVEIGTFLTFADFFWDGLIADFMVQSRINETRRNVEQARAKVVAMMNSLRSIH
ncbi:MAG: hypothetical protein PHI83_02845 [Sphaerochaetaceae bacterium]|jgi:hypothetical protein|nr:hypothetical protein [Sphaerochaetaceae bacterium]